MNSLGRKLRLLGSSTGLGCASRCGRHYSLLKPKSNVRICSDLTISRNYRALPWMKPSPFASTDRKKDGLALFSPKDVLVWVDCEMTGLLNTDSLLEVAMLITDNSLSVVAGGFNVVIHQSEECLQAMLPEVWEMHSRTDLITRVRKSSVSLEQASEQINEYMGKFLDQTQQYHMAGSSVHVDLNVLRRHMPNVASHFSHRVVDVTGVSELLQRWAPNSMSDMDTHRLRSTHEAMSDIMASISLLRFVRERGFRGDFKT